MLTRLCGGVNISRGLLAGQHLSLHSHLTSVRIKTSMDAWYCARNRWPPVGIGRDRHLMRHSRMMSNNEQTYVSYRCDDVERSMVMLVNPRADCSHIAP